MGARDSRSHHQVYTMTAPAHPANRLIEQTSPYLRQHAHNPVDWYPWGEEALKRARDLDRPIFLSIGYSACHWCHVMERESFEDEDTARILNEHFVSIKVDREERPDLDQIYMTAVQLMTRHGGWPMSVFLTPDLHPFYGGTYFPPADRHGLPSFRRLLLAIVEAWQNRRAELMSQAKDLSGHVHQAMQIDAQPGALDDGLLRGAGSYLRQAFDPTYGGFGRAPKFPHPMDLRLLLRLWQRFGDDDALRMATTTLDHMARGGMYDQLGGGFHRYSTDARWLVPHFEKMLYDNALLTVAYLEAFQATGNPFYREVVEHTLAYIEREMTSPAGAFYSTQDADSEGEEGKFFVWSRAEVEAVLGHADATLFCDVYDVTSEGNWEGHNILNRSRGDEQEAAVLKMPVDELRRRLAECRRKLFQHREERIKPGLDDKILTSWNALMIGAFARAGAVLNNEAYTRRAVAAGDFLLHRMRRTDGRLYRTCRADDAQPRLRGYLEDYAYLIDALVSLYEATFTPRWIAAARNLSDILFEQFWDERTGGFFYTGKDHEQLISRGKDPHDNATPSGNAMAATGLLRLGALTGDRRVLDGAERTLQLFRGLMAEMPAAAGQMLIALDFYLGPVAEVVVVGEMDRPQVPQALAALRGGFRPRQVLAWRGADDAAAVQAEKHVPLVAGRAPKGDVTTYFCQDFTCEAPLVGVDALRARLAEAR
jgi:uncharacterized protein YyaL (SSP411 family)